MLILCLSAAYNDHEIYGINRSCLEIAQSITLGVGHRAEPLCTSICSRLSVWEKPCDAYCYLRVHFISGCFLVMLFAVSHLYRS